MYAMFTGANSFNQPIGNWNVSKVTDFSFMFNACSVFNQNIGSWNVSGVTDMTSMFQSSAFNNGGSPSISGWSVSNVTNFVSMFSGANSFNQPIGNWTLKTSTGNTISMASMFQVSTAFNQDIGSWNITRVNNFSNFMSNKTSATFSATNLDAIYNGWSTKSPRTGITISFGTAKYTAAGITGRNTLTGATYNWTIVDGGI
jgi:surface protein